MQQYLQIFHTKNKRWAAQVKAKEKNREIFSVFHEVRSERKPCSVPAEAGRDHLSLRFVTKTLEDNNCLTATSRGTRSGPPRCALALAPSPGVASDRVYICRQSPVLPVSSYLAFPSLPHKVRRSISVALSLRSPSADVIRYPAL